MSQESFPPLHSKDFGLTDAEGKAWWGRFLFMKPRWAFVFLNVPESGDVERATPIWECSGIGETPKIAFYDCVRAWIALNENVESPTLKQILKVADDFFTDDGGVKLGYLVD